jgi:hypothetical protein
MIEPSEKNGQKKSDIDKYLTYGIYLMVFLIAVALMLDSPDIKQASQKKFPRVHEINLREYEGRALSSMRTISTALEAYRSSHGAYPPPRAMRHIPLKSRVHTGVNLTNVYTYPAWEDLQNQIPASTFYGNLGMQPDPFTGNSRLPYAYYTVGDRYVLHSVAPDGEYSFRPKIDVNWDAPDWQQEQQRIKNSNHAYNKYNGPGYYTPGDYIRFSGQ